MNPFDAIAPFYDLEHECLTLDTTMYVDMLRDKHCDVLVIGAGTGRVVRAVAEASATVVGIDTSPAMLELAAHKLPRYGNVSLVLADMRTFDLSRRFDLIIVPLDTFLLVTSHQEQLQCLQRFAAHLQSSGRLVVDMINPFMLPNPRQNGLIRHRFDGTIERGMVSVSDEVHIDPSTQMMTMTLRYTVTDGSVEMQHTVELPVRWVYLDEVQLIMRDAGLRLRDAFGFYDGSGYDQDSERLIVTATLS